MSGGEVNSASSKSSKPTRAASAGTLTPRLNFGHIGPQWATLFENAALGDRLSARNLLSAQVTYQRGDWRVTAYGTNLTDQTYNSTVNGGLSYVGPPRQYGLRLSKTF